MSSPISPAIIINETYRVRPQVDDGYNVLVTGFTTKGIANEPFVFNNIDEWVSVFGEPDPSNPETIYAYDAAKRVVDSGATLIFVKLPYGACEGIDVGTDYSALIFPALEDRTALSAIVGYEVDSFIPASAFGALSGDFPVDDDIEVGEIIATEYIGALSSFIEAEGATFTPVIQEVDCKGFVLGEPKRICLSEAEYDQIKCNQFDWNDFQPITELSAFDADLIGNAGLIILDNGRSTTNDAKDGYYITVTDNSDADPATDFDAITGIQTSYALSGEAIWEDVPDECYAFDLDSPFTSNVGSLSQTIANLASQIVYEPWENPQYKNYLSINLWRMRPDVSNGSALLVPSLVETHTGSVSETETVITEGGYDRNVFLSDIVGGQSNRLCVLFNPKISEAQYTDATGDKVLNIRMYRNSPDVLGGLTLTGPNALPVGIGSGFEYADNAYSISKFVSKTNKFACDVGDIPLKLKNALCSVDNPDRITIDLSIEAGLGTVWTTVKEDRNSWLTGDQRDCSFCYDDCAYLDVKEDLGRTVPEGQETGEMRIHWREVLDCFRDFLETRTCYGGYRHPHIADPLRQIFVNSHCKTYDAKTRCKNAGAFAECIYWPLKNLTRGLNDSHISMDAQWWETTNVYTSGPVWTPSSSVVASLFASTPNPWDAAAGVTRGLVNQTGIIDGAIDPVQRDRDLLWKLHTNASFYDGAFDSFIRFADQSMLKNDDIQLRNNSARRLITWLSRNLRTSVRPFLFEPNNLQTRVRFRNTIEPFLRLLQDNGAIDDYVISLNRNTAEIQQQGCLVADIGIKINGVVEQIKLNYDITRLDEPFRVSVG